MVTELGVLAKDATQRGDDHAADVLRGVAGHLMDVHGDLSALEERRRKDRQRPRRKVHRTTESTEAAESVDKSGFPSDSPSSKEQQSQHDAREAITPAVVAKSEMVEMLTGMLSREMGALWPDADAFLRRRSYATWEGWLKEMRSLTTGTQYTVEDLAQVCRDDLALERPIGSPKGLRIFLGSAKRERTEPAPATRRPSPLNIDSALDTWAKDSDAKERKRA